MDDVRKNDWIVITIRWIARIWGSIGAAFLLFMTIGSLLGPENLPTFGEWIQLLFFPFGVSIGLIAAWKWEGVGGLIAIGSVIVFHGTMLISHGRLDLNPFIDGIAAPGLLFLICWLLSRERSGISEAN